VRAMLMMAPAFEALSDEYKGKVTFAKMNTDENMHTRAVWVSRAFRR